LALFINSAILIVSAATFHFSGNQNVAEIQAALKKPEFSVSEEFEREITVFL
jgi:Mn2+/Fe2+ NRAMP family transporter